MRVERSMCASDICADARTVLLKQVAIKVAITCSPTWYDLELDFTTTIFHYEAMFVIPD